MRFKCLLLALLLLRVREFDWICLFVEYILIDGSSLLGGCYEL